jgi:hypothetical protein
MAGFGDLLGLSLRPLVPWVSVGEMKSQAFSAPEVRAGPGLVLMAARLSCVSSQTEQVERNYIKEKKAAVKEFEDKKVELKENLIAELEEKKKMIENEKLTMELTGGTEAGPCELSRHSSHARGRAGELASRPTPQQLGA